MAKILLVDDEPAVTYALGEVLEHHTTVRAGSAEEALTLLEGIDVVVTDLSMPGMDGLALLRRIRDERPGVPVILLTARGSERTAVSAMKAGAHDYLAKPFDVDELRHVVDRAAELALLRRRDRIAAAERAIGHRIVGHSPALRRLLALVERVAPRDVHVLVTGETGTGKEAIAALLHVHGARASGPLVRFNCAAVPESLAESELFGHVRGAFTGAIAERRGYFEQADGGTLVLDEIGELPPGLQAKLLRVAQDGEIRRVGADAPRRVDVRLVACTHRDLRAWVAAGRFREDLFYRLAVVELVVPPLRARREDIPALAQAFALRHAARFGLDDVELTPELIEELTAQPWPGNIRELDNTVARLVALSGGGRIGPEAHARPSVAATETGSFRQQVAAFEHRLLAEALQASDGNQSEAARRLGMSRVTFIDRMKKHGL
ncbi:MAG: sigma-54-dependent Fis family transcriptional regulator [Deltaproteobacteria bacterium]|nr:sigma-54-dependent Fis family transcriptional regulator [Deltaproteobacteria bacterium]